MTTFITRPGGYRALSIILALTAFGASAPALAAGTAAGSTISNTATATFDGPGGTPVTIPSNKVDLRVDEVLNVTVVTAEAGDVPTTPGATGQVVRYRVTNTGNGSEAFRLSAITAIGGDQFDPTATSIVLDTNNNGVYDPLTDTVYSSGGNDPVLAPDASITVFILTTIPSGVTDTNRGQVDLSAVAVTGTGTPGTVFAGQGANGSDAVVGATSATGRDRNFLAVSAASVALVKSAAVLDPFGGTTNVPGAVITYTLVATTSGSGTLANLQIADPIPAGTTYVASSLTAQGSPLTDTVGDDAGEHDAGRITARFGSVAGGQTRTVTFKVKIN